MPIPIPSEIIDDDRLIQALREVCGMKAEFDLAEVIRKENEAYMARARLADERCPICAKLGVNRCDCDRG